jgi:hypothetical protein
MFHIRHILVHELPQKAPYEEYEIDLFLDAAGDLVLRLTEALREFIYGTKTFADKLVDVERQLEALLKDVANGFERAKRTEENASRLEIIERSQQTWEAFVETDCELWGSLFEGLSSTERSFTLAHRRVHHLTQRLKLFPAETEDPENN